MNTFFALTKKSVFVASVFVALFFTACRVQFVPNYEADLSRQIETIAKTVDHFYLAMLEKAMVTNKDRTYEKFSDGYIDIEVELNSLYNKNKVRPLNQNSTRIAEIALQIWTKYKAEHKEDNTISDGIIKLNRKYMNDLFYAMRVAEEAKRIASPSNP